MDKKSYILEKLVEEYIKSPEPISSKHLQKNLDISISSATIRYYFQQLSKSGAITQTHISSGRIPTLQTLKEFWKKRLYTYSFNTEEGLTKILDRLSHQERIFCEVNIYNDMVLEDVEVYNKYLICNFTQGDFILSYNKNLERFFKNQIGQKGVRLAKICNDIGLVQVSKSLKRFLTKDFQYFMLEELIEIANEDTQWANRYLKSILDGEFIYQSDKGLSFYKSILSFKFFVKERSEKMEVVLIGRLYRNYLNLINQIKGESYGEKR